MCVSWFSCTCFDNVGKPDKGINHKLWSSYRAVHVTTIWTSQIRKNQSQVMVKLQSCTCYHNMGNHSQVMVNLQSSTCFNNMGKPDKAITHKLWSSYRAVHVSTICASQIRQSITNYDQATLLYMFWQYWQARMGNHSQVMVKLQSSTCFDNIGKPDKAIIHKLWSSYRAVHISTIWASLIRQSLTSYGQATEQYMFQQYGQAR